MAILGCGGGSGHPAGAWHAVERDVASAIQKHSRWQCALRQAGPPPISRRYIKNASGERTCAFRSRIS